MIGNYTTSRKVGILATKGTVTSESYSIEISNFYPDIEVFQHACPLWVPFVESGDYKSDAVDAIVKQDLEQLFEKNDAIDTVLLACTHYPLLKDKIEKYLPPNVSLISQGSIVANSLKDYLQRHVELENRITKCGTKSFFTTDDIKDFEEHATTFFGEAVKAQHVHLEV